MDIKLKGSPSCASIMKNGKPAVFAKEFLTMEKETKRVIQLVCSLLLGSRDPAIIPYLPAKTAIPATSLRYFKRTAPYKKGVSVGRIQNFLSELEANPACFTHSVMVLKDGEIICEAYAPGFERGLVHLSHSMSKTVTGIAVAMLADEEKLNTDTALSEIFTEFTLPPSVGEITVGELITMSAGLSFSEAGSVTSEEWTLDFLSSEQAFPHGEGYRYNSMNSYILARIVERLSGESFEDFIRARLFAPLKITEWLWEKGSEGTVKGGWGLYLSLEDWLKIASLFLTGGAFGGIQIISHLSMLELLLAKNEFSNDGSRDFYYAGHLSLSKSSSAVLFNGLFGQNVYIDPSQGLAVAVNSGNNEIFKDSALLDIILKYFPPDMNDKRIGGFAGLRQTHALLKQESRFFESRGFVRTRRNKGLLERLHIRAPEFPEEWNAILGKYLLPMNNAELLPIVVRTMQNNLEGGIDTVEFLRVGSLPTLRLTLGKAVRDIPIGIYSHEGVVIDFHGEKYRVRTLGGTEDTESGKIYKIEFVFPELQSTRTLSIKKTGDFIEMTFGETPSADAIIPFMEKLTSSSNMGALALGMVERKLGEGFIEKKLRELFAPSFKAPLERSPDAEKILAEENARIEKKREEILSVPFISNFVRTEIRKEPEKEDVSKRRRGIIGIISDIFRLRAKSESYRDEIDDEDEFPSSDK